MSEEDRLLLRKRFVSGAGIDDLARIYSVDRSTAARRVARRVRELRSELNAALRLHFGPLDVCEVTRFLLGRRIAMAFDASALLDGQTEPNPVPPSPAG